MPVTRLHIAFAVWFLLLTGCATMPATDAIDEGLDAAANKCVALYVALDRAVDAAGVRDAGETRLVGFPHLRADRFSASFRDAARTDPALRSTLVRHLADLDLLARRVELANLPAAAQPDASLLALCGQTMVAADLSNPQRGAALLDRLAVPDDYSAAKRVLGAYALNAVPFFAGVTRWQDETQEIFSSAKSGEGVHRIRPTTAPTDAVGAPIALARNALGIPSHSPEQWQVLLARHAPILDIVTRTGADRFGALQWRGDDIHVDTESPIAYSRVAYTRFQGETLAQLVYTFWFPERPVTGLFDLLGGHLDGLMVRITLDHDGTPLMVDSIHACGCYQLFFPSSRLSPRPPPAQNIEWAFVPKNLPPLREGERIVLRVAAGTHYLEDIGITNAARGDDRYALADEQSLRVLPTPNGHTRSAYGPDGLIAGSERGERFVFWPMGIASPGAMRQWGRHATAFVGRRHFDDADLIERRFERVK